MGLRFYDTKSASIRDFEPLTPGQVRLYYCGATVQGKPHVGHVRSAIVFDILVRWLEYRGFDVLSVRNVTDIDDKILEKSAASYEPDFTPEVDYPAQEPWFVLAYRFEQEFHRAYDALGVRRPSYEPRATGHIPEMHELIQRLIDAGHAYRALDGSADVYFDVRSWNRYGELTRQSADDMQGAADADPRGKKDPRDFALWKAVKESEPLTASWDSPWGRGRPGWHIECSAMATKYLGGHFDIHGGGLDLRFPHHENELAQSCAAGDDFANFWMHNGMVTYEGEKMSKSIGNTISPDEMLSMARAKVVRFFLGQAHYRSMLDYRPTSLEEAGNAVERIETFIDRANAVADKLTDIVLTDEVPEAFGAAMDDDLNVPQALAVLHATVTAGNTALANGDDESALQALGQVQAMVEVLGLTDADTADAAGDDELLGALLDSLLVERAQARENKDWNRADEIRDQLAGVGIQIEDGPDGATWSRKD
ncbi:cysteine--tRNA ligase [Micrococcoides hystricis]|uniref:Cysteine--tRNA ligase n=1 Tax=Micrococcoides hystricis TaxID=1572761 RepID=A0ABV6PB06_9MICC